MVNSSESDELREQLSKMSAVCEHQNKMIAALTHDMRSPLSVILTASQIADLPNIKEEKRHRNLALVQDAARQLQSLIQDVFDLSRLQLGELDFINLRKKGCAHSALDCQRLPAAVPWRPGAAQASSHQSAHQRDQVHLSWEHLRLR